MKVLGKIMDNSRLTILNAEFTKLLSGDYGSECKTLAQCALDGNKYLKSLIIAHVMNTRELPILDAVKLFDGDEYKLYFNALLVEYLQYMSGINIAISHSTDGQKDSFQSLLPKSGNMYSKSITFFDSLTKHELTHQQNEVNPSE